jgi:Tol biopolymer transport system component
MSTFPVQALFRHGIALALTCAALQAQTTIRASVDSSGIEGNGVSAGNSISADGLHVAFASSATNLVAGDTNAVDDIFVRDLQTGTTTRVSVANSGAQADNGSFSPSISGDGRYIVFSSAATNLVMGDTNLQTDIFVHDRVAGTTKRVSLGAGGAQANNSSGFPHVTPDGRYVLFFSLASNLVAGDTNAQEDTFVRDLQFNITTRASLDSAGAQGNNDSFSGAITPDGRYVAFESYASNLVAGDTNGVQDVFLRDLQLLTTTRVSVDSAGTQGNNVSVNASISADGRFVAFHSTSTNLVPSDTNGVKDAFVRDRQTGTTTRVSVSSAGVQGDGVSSEPQLSADGRFVAFYSAATNLVAGDTNALSDVFLHDRLNNTTQRVSVTTGGAEGNSSSLGSQLTPDGRFVNFFSSATNLVAGDTNGVLDVFVRDRGAASSFTSFCFGDGSVVPCPCGNNGGAGRGCQNSASTGGAQLVASGTPSLSADTLLLTSSGGLPSSFGIPLQGSTAVAHTAFGDGLRCAGGTLVRLYVKAAVGGVITAPQGGDPTISARSAALGDTIPLGATRIYQVYYRDPDPTLCPLLNQTFNASQAVAVAWGS